MQAGPLVARPATAEEPALHCTLHFGESSGMLEDSLVISGGAACGTFAPHQLLGGLQTAALGRLLFTAASTASTQTVVQDNVRGLPDGLVFVADKQHGGKGERVAGWCGGGATRRCCAAPLRRSFHPTRATHPSSHCRPAPCLCARAQAGEATAGSRPTAA